MGRKRKTRWRRLSIGGNSEEEAERESEILGFSKMNPPSRIRSGSQPAIVNSYASSATPSPSTLPTMNGSGGKFSGSSPSAGHSSQEPKPDEPSSHGRVNGYGNGTHPQDNHHQSPHHHNGYRGEHHGHGGHHREYKESRNGDGSYNGYHSNGGYYPSSNYYHHRNSYNSGGGSYRGGGYEGSGYRGRGGGHGGDYHGSSRFGGRFRKPRPYASNYYYNNGPSSSGGNEEGTTNRPSYNQEEYTKITTPRQDVLFKKGYLSQRKAVTQTSSVDSTSGPTTPSTNGTPDTHSTNGLNSDYSEGYENGETECGLVPYDDTLYYGLPPETAVFTDPTTGQVYYGQSNGEYFDAYPLSPVMMGGYPTPLYYHLPYPGTDWNGLPTPIYPIVPLGPPPLDDHQSIQNGDTAKGDTGTGKGNENNSSDTGKESKRIETTSGPLTNGIHKKSKIGKKNGGETGTLSDSSTSSSREGSTSTFSSAASTPMSPPINANGQLMTSLAISMSSMTLVDRQTQLHQLQPIHPSIPPPIPVSHFMAAHPPPTHHPHHPQQILYHPHPAFVYAPPTYNGVVVPIAPVASSAETQSSPSSRKKRKLRRRKKDDGQLTGESSAEDETVGNTDEPPSCPTEDEELLCTTKRNLALNLSSTEPTSSADTSPSKSSQSESATKKDLIAEEDHCLGIPTSNDSLTKIATIQDSLTLENQTILKEDGDDVVNPEQSSTSQAEIDNDTPTTVSEPTTYHPVLSTSTLSSKKPQDLGLGLDLISTPEGLETDEVSLPLEPTTPDSLNTTQSLLGSEIPSVSISETDFMNRTTSVDEVEEDILPEDNESSQGDIRSRQKSRTTSLEDETEPLTSVSASISIPRREFHSFESSPPPLTLNDTEVTPSPETKFERSLELVKVTTTGTLGSEPFQRIELLGSEICEEGAALEVEIERCYEYPTVSGTVPRFDVDTVSIQEPTVALTSVGEETENRSICSSPLDRPKSITLAVAEWLKVRGPDALTPVSQLQELFQQGDDDDFDDDDSEDDDDDSLTTKDLTKLDSSSGQPQSCDSSKSNCSIQ